jgi:polysaccharide biosynthesis transport protein
LRKAGFNMPLNNNKHPNNKADRYTPPAADEPIDIPALYYIILEKRFVILSLVVAGLLAAGVYLVRAPKVYAAETIVQIEQTPHKVLNIQDVNSEDLSGTEVPKTIEENLSNPALLQRVISAEHLDSSSLGLPPRKEGYTSAELIRAFSKDVSARLIKGTRLITVTVENQSPNLAQQLSLAVVNQYRQMNIEQRLAVVTEANGVLATEAARLKEKLQKSEQALQDYKERTQAVSLQETQNITVEKLKELNAKVTAAKGERLKLEADRAQAQKIIKSDPEELLKLPSVAESKAVIDQKRLVAEQEGVVANLSKRYGPLHPKLIQAKSQLEALRAGLNDVSRRAASSIDSSYEAAKEAEAKFEQALREQEQTALELNRLAIPYAVLEREMASDRALFDAVLSRMKETDVTKSIQQDDIIVKSPATVPDRPIRPRKLLILAGSVVVAFLLGVGGVLAMRAFDSSIRTVVEAEQLFDVPALAVVPTAEPHGSSRTPLVMLNDPSGFAAEAFRTLRTSLALNDTQKLQTVLFTSALPDEGKSFCAINYAAACAQQNLRTLLVDADLRFRSIGRMLLSDDTRPGVVELLRSESILDVCTQETSIAGLAVLTAGHRAPNPLELLAGNEFHELIEEAKGKFDRIVIDSAPVNAVSDSLLLMKSAETVCMVVRAGRTPQNAVLRALEKLKEAGANLRGFVLNQVPANAKLAAYYGYPIGRYGKGVYGAEEIGTIAERRVNRPRADARLHGANSQTLQK